MGRTQCFMITRLILCHDRRDELFRVTVQPLLVTTYLRRICDNFESYRFPSVLHYLDNTKLEHITVEDQKKFEDNLFLKNSAAFQRTYWLISIALEMGAFCLQFLEWWHTERSNAGMTSYNNSLAPPLPSQEKLWNKCPLCRSSYIQAPTILTTCGFVFCYRCIMTYLKEHGKCPLSGILANTENLVRLFSK